MFSLPLNIRQQFWT